MYSVFVFLHIVGALGLFASIAIEQVSLANLRGANSNVQARDWLAVLGGLRRVNGPSGLVLLVTGVYMLATRWGQQAWAGLAVLGMVLIAVLASAATGRRVGAIKRSLPATDGPVSVALRERLDDPVLRTSASFKAAIALGIVFNMSVKPATVGALAVMGVALALGAAVAFLRSPRSRQGMPARQHGEA